MVLLKGHARPRHRSGLCPAGARILLPRARACARWAARPLFAARTLWGPAPARRPSLRVSRACLATRAFNGRLRLLVQVRSAALRAGSSGAGAEAWVAPPVEELPKEALHPPLRPGAPRPVPFQPGVATGPGSRQMGLAGHCLCLELAGVSLRTGAPEKATVRFPGVRRGSSPWKRTGSVRCLRGPGCDLWGPKGAWGCPGAPRVCMRPDKLAYA